MGGASFQEQKRWRSVQTHTRAQQWSKVREEISLLSFSFCYPTSVNSDSGRRKQLKASYRTQMMPIAMCIHDTAHGTHCPRHSGMGGVQYISYHRDYQQTKLFPISRRPTSRSSSDHLSDGEQELWDTGIGRAELCLPTSTLNITESTQDFAGL